MPTIVAAGANLLLMRCYVSDFLAKTRETPKVVEKTKAPPVQVTPGLPVNVSRSPPSSAAVLGNSLVVRSTGCSYDRVVIQTALSVAIEVD